MSVVESLFQLLGVGATLAVGLMLFILGLLSKRLGEVTHTRPYYRWLYGAAALTCIAAFFEFLYILSTFSEGSDTSLLYNKAFYVVTYVIPLAISLTIGAIVSWRYWSWLVIERDE